MSSPSPLPLQPIRTFAGPLGAVDEVSASPWTTGGMTVTATRRVEATEPYLEAHFPGFTILPGAFMVEGLVCAVAAALGPERTPYLRRLRSARFLAPALAGDAVTWSATVTSLEDGALFVEGQCVRRDGTRVATLVLALALERHDAA